MRENSPAHGLLSWVLLVAVIAALIAAGAFAL
jgi:hypothetical protein